MPELTPGTRTPSFTEASAISNSASQGALPPCPPGQPWALGVAWSLRGGRNVRWARRLRQWPGSHDNLALAQTRVGY